VKGDFIYRKSIYKIVIDMFENMIYNVSVIDFIFCRIIKLKPKTKKDESCICSSIWLNALLDVYGEKVKIVL